MLDRQRLARKGPASALLLALIFLVLSLASYDPADPPGSAAEPANDPVANPCGPVGALLAHGLYQTLGWSSWVVLLILASADVLWLARRAVPEWWVRLLGFALAIAVASALVQKLAPGLEPSPPVGSGGYLGALAVAFLEGQFGPAGMLLILVAGGLVGLALCNDVLVLWPVQEVLHALRLGSKAAAAAKRSRRPQRRRCCRPSRASRWSRPARGRCRSPRRPCLGRPPEAIEVPVPRALQPSAAPQDGGILGAGPPAPPRGGGYSLAAARRCSSPRSRSRSRSTRPRSTPGPCCWSARCSTSVARSASSRSTPGR